MAKLTDIQKKSFAKIHDDLIRINLKLQVMQKEVNQMDNGFWNDMVDALDVACNMMDNILDE